MNLALRRSVLKSIALALLGVLVFSGLIIYVAVANERALNDLRIEELNRGGYPPSHG